MKALILEQPGEEPRLAVRDIPSPTPKAGEVLVRVLACGFCHHDALVMRGRLRRGVQPDIVLGHEMAGEVAEVGPGGTSLKPGDRVVSILTDACGRCERCQTGREHRCLDGRGIGHSIRGGFAEYVMLREFSLVPVPSEIDPVQACLLGCPIGAALQAVRDVGGLVAGETVLVDGAGGGLGIHAVQVARMLGARVLAVTTSPDKAAGIRSMGAHEVVLVGEVPFSEEVMALTQDRGVDLALDTVGSPLFIQCLRSLSQYGRLVAVGEVSGRPVSLRLAELIFRDARVLASSGVSRRRVSEAAGLAVQGKLTPVVSQVFPLEDTLRAYQLMMERKLLGRAVIRPS